jgi:hypothetical protein
VSVPFSDQLLGVPQVEGGYEDEEPSESADGPTAEEAKGDKLAAIAKAIGELTRELDEDLLPVSPATRLRKTLKTFFGTYVRGVDFENLHLFESLEGFHVVPAVRLGAADPAGATMGC